jgi:hypothetical protein
MSGGKQEGPMTEFYVFRGTAIGEVEEGVLEGFWRQLDAGLSRGLEFVKFALESPSIGPRSLT